MEPMGAEVGVAAAATAVVADAAALPMQAWERGGVCCWCPVTGVLLELVEPLMLIAVCTT